MPVAGGSIAAQVKYAWQDHDTDEVDENPPVQNTWYEVFDAEDVRLIWCIVYQKNDEAAAKDVEIKWTIDGTVYLSSLSLADDTVMWIYRYYDPSAVGTDGLSSAVGRCNGADDADKRGLAFKVEVRMTAVPGTNQQLLCDCVRETLEAT